MKVHYSKSKEKLFERNQFNRIYSIKNNKVKFNGWWFILGQRKLVINIFKASGWGLRDSEVAILNGAIEKELG